MSDLDTTTPTACQYYRLEWRDELSGARRRERLAIEQYDRLYFALLLLLAAIGPLCFGFFVWSHGLLAQPFDFVKPDKLLLFVWLSFIVDCYLWYLLNNPREHEATVVRCQQKERNHESIINVVSAFRHDSTQAVWRAIAVAEQYKHATVEPIHLFISLLDTPDVRTILYRLEVTSDQLEQYLVSALAAAPTSDGTNTTYSPQAQTVLLSAYSIAADLGHTRVTPAAVLMALVSIQGRIREMLLDLGLDEQKITNMVRWTNIYDQLRDRVRAQHRAARLRPKNLLDRAMSGIETRMLNVFSTDLTLQAAYGHLLPLMGRSNELAEISRLIQFGSRSVILVGPVGCGKRAIIEGLAQNIIIEDVPPALQDKRLVEINAAKIVSGVDQSRAQERLLTVLQEAAVSGNVIIFIESLDRLWRAAGSGGLALVDVLFNTAQRLGLTVLSTTTPDFYRQVLEAYGTVASSMSKVVIPPIDRNDAIVALESKTPIIEARNKVFFSYKALERAVDVAQRYMTDQALPGSAIGLIEEVAPYVAQKKGTQQVVSAEDVATVASAKLHINVTEVSGDERTQLVQLEERMHQRVVAQDEAISAVSTSLRRARTQLRDPKRPIATLLFLGPTGVGKTEVAKTVAEVFFGREQDMVRLDMSEYQEPSAVRLLLGQGDRPGLLTEQIRQNPYTVLLLDEFEKAHTDVLNVFLQIMDDGRATDHLGRVVDFTNAIVIATSNVGTDIIQDRMGTNTPLAQIKEELMNTSLRQRFRPELINRFDNIIVFTPLSLENVRQIASIQLDRLKGVLAAQNVNFRATEAAVSELAQQGFHPEYGARPLRRVIQDRVESKIADYLLSNQLQRRDTLVYDVGGLITIEKGEQLLS